MSRDQEILFEAISQIEDLETKKKYFEKLKDLIIQEPKQQSIQHYNLKDIFSHFEPKNKKTNNYCQSSKRNKYYQGKIF